MTTARIILSKNIFLLLFILSVSFLSSSYGYAAGPDTFTTKSGTSLPSASMANVAYGNGVYVAVGSYGAIIKSTDADTWVNVKTKADSSSYTGVTDASTFGFNGVSFGNGVFVATGSQGGIILSSADGTTWTQRTSGVSTGIWDIEYLTFNGSSAFYALTTGLFLKSTDGITWTSVVPTGTNPSYQFTEVTVGNSGTRLALGLSDGRIFSTTNGTVWTISQPTSPAWSTGINMLRWFNDRYFISDPSAYLWTSTDLSTFTLAGSPFKQTALDYGNQMFNGFYDGSKYYLFGYQSPYGYGAVYTSPDASTWTMQTYNNYFVGQNAVLANGKYFRLGNEGMLVSSDGLNWSYKWGGHFNDIIYDGANYIAAGWQGGDGAIWSSADLQTWTKGSLSAHSKMFYTVAFGNSTYVAIGDLDGTTTTLATSGNGTTWTKQTGINDSSYIYDVAFGNGTFVAVGFKSDNSVPVLKTSADGVTWSTPTLPSTTSIQLNSVTYINNQFVAVGYDTTSAVMIWTSPDGTTWSDKSSTYPVQTDGLVNILYDGSKYILLGFDPSTYELFSRSSSDLSTWSSATVLTGSAYTYNYSSQLGKNGNNIYVLSYDPTWTYIMVYYSDDQGQTWQDTGMATSTILPFAISEVNNQLVISGDGQLVMAASSNAAPTVTGTALGQAVNDTATVSPFSGVTIADADANNVTATITLDSSAKGAFTAGSLTASSFSTADGGITYTHASATPGAMTTALQALVYQPTANRVNPPLTETTTFSIAVNDGAVTTNSTNTTTVVSTSINDAPAVGGATAVTNINDNATATPFSAFTIADDDAAQTQTVSVTLDVAAKGSFTTLNGFTNAGGVYTFNGTAAAAQTAIRGLVFTPTANRVAPGSTETTTFTVSVSDGIAAAATNNSTTVVTTSINDAPVLNAALSPALNGLGINPAAPSNGSTTGSTLVSALVAGISDVDVGAVMGIAITATDTVNGTLYYSTNAGTSWTTVGAVTAGSALLLASDASSYLYYQSNNGVSGNLASALTFRAWDQTTGTAASKVDTTTNGTTTAFSTVTDTVSISIYPPPTIGGMTAEQAVTDKTTVAPFAATTIADSLGNNVTVIVTLDTQAKGSFTTLSGFTNNGNGSYTLTNVTAAAAQTAIRGLVFTPAANRVAPGSTETTTFTVGVTDVVTTIVATDTTTVVSTSINDAPANTVVPAISGTATVGNILSAGSGTWTDVDPGASLSYSYQWYRANDSGGTGEAPIGGATANSYTITASDAHQYLRVVVTANDGQGSADQTATSTRSVVANSAPVNTVIPAISGTSKVGSLLSATSGTWTDADGDTPTYTYQWYRADDNSGTNEAAISGATNNSYTLTTSDAHKYLRVVVTANDGHGSADQTATTTRTIVTNTAPVNTVVPAISGTSKVASLLTASPGTWTDADGDTLSYTYQWYRADDNSGTNEAAISGATTSGYTPTVSDAHKYLRVVVTANDGHGSSNLTETSTRTALANSAPANTVVPAISGTSTVGSLLTATTGTWTDADGDIPTYTYQWYRADDNSGTNEAAIPSATAGTYTLTVSDTHKYLRVVVTANDGHGSSDQTATSTRTAAANSAPFNTVVPVISGTTTIGSLLSATSGTWTDADGDSPSYTYQWYRADDNSGTNEAAISGETTGTYTLTAGDTHKYLRIVVTANDGHGSADQTATSTRTAVANAAPVNTVVPVISGTNTVGSTLAATAGTWTDSDGDTPTYSYQWYRADDNSGINETAISGATGGNYTLTTSDAHKYLRVIVTANDGHGSADQTATSTRTALANAAPVNTVVPVISGTNKVGSTLSVTSGTWTDADGDTPTFTYQWKADGSVIVGKTLPTCLLTAAQSKKTITCTITADDGNGGTPIITTDGVLVANSAPVFTGTPAITGRAKIKQKLSLADTGTSDADGDTVTLSYQWAAGGVDIPGAISETYLLTVNEDKKSITCTLTADDGNSGVTHYTTLGVNVKSGFPWWSLVPGLIAPKETPWILY